jgi:hypothetical protein
VACSAIGVAGSAGAPAIGLAAHQLVAINALAAGSQIRVSLAASISA